MTHRVVGNTFIRNFFRINPVTLCIEYGKSIDTVATNPGTIMFSAIKYIEVDNGDPCVLVIAVPDGERDFLYHFRTTSDVELVRWKNAIEKWIHHVNGDDDMDLDAKSNVTARWIHKNG